MSFSERWFPDLCSLSAALQEELIPFFSEVRLAPESNTAELAYLELAEKVS